MERVIASLYEAFPPEKAGRLGTRRAPKSGSWLDIAEIEIDVMTTQGINRRVDNIEASRDE
ncbi:MAG: hypothetical protein LBG43_11430 [Treponema sp.]|nr:hypothetical protein [Treponema sp.]